MSDGEFSRMVRVDTIGGTPHRLWIEADARELAALANRFRLAKVGRLAAQVELAKSTGYIVAAGRIEAEVTQSCVVTGEPVPARVDEAFAIRFRAPPEVGGPDEEIELAADELDVMFIEGAQVDIGEAVAQTLALSLDPYPRAGGAQTVMKQSGVASPAGPFDALAAIRDKLGK